MTTGKSFGTNTSSPTVVGAPHVKSNTSYSTFTLPSVTLNGMDNLLTLARDAAKKAGEAITPHYGTDAFTLKTDNSPVTLADTAADAVLGEMLRSSGIPILSEEDAEKTTLPYPERIWVIDPLDGTKGFLNHTDDFSVMIALLEKGRPVLAVVHAPILKKHYFATKGGGAFVEDEGGVHPLRVSSRISPNLRGLVSVNHAAPYMFDICTKLEVTETIAIGSIGIKSGYIGDDRADFYVTRGALGEWDVCAPELILTEAGGMVTDEDGAPLCYRNEDHRIKHGVVFSNGACHEAVLTALASS
jgi:3'(2'), 5'-bisphosphate nucleotidase